MKINEIKTPKGKRVWAVVCLADGAGGNIGDVEVMGVYSSLKEAQRELASLWYTDGEVFMTEDESTDKEIQKLSEYLKSPNFNFLHFQKLSEKLAEKVSLNGPDFEDHLEYYNVVETELF